jgi:hypothetical protein
MSSYRMPPDLPVPDVQELLSGIDSVRDMLFEGED